MNKKTLLIAALSTVFVCGIATVAISGATQLRKLAVNANGDGVAHQIVLNASNVSNVEDDGYYLNVDLFKSKATRNGNNFSISEAYMHADGSMSSDEDHIFVGISGEYYADIFFGMSIELMNIHSLVSIVFSGEFYYDSELEYYSSKIEYGPSNLTSVNTVNVYEDSMYKVVLDSIEINYTCAA